MRFLTLILAVLLSGLTACDSGHSYRSPGTSLPSYRSSPVTPGYSTPARAENGSYYGEISSETGRPKTVPVQGYYRKDGTYVQGHYRSPPRRK